MQDFRSWTLVLCRIIAIALFSVIPLQAVYFWEDDRSLEGPGYWHYYTFTVTMDAQFYLWFASDFNAEAIVFHDDDYYWYANDYTVSAYAYIYGTFGERTFRLPPGDYVIAVKNYNNGGNLYDFTLYQTTPEPDISGFVSYNIDFARSSVRLTADSVRNKGGGLTGTLRLELWALDRPYDPAGGSNGYQLASHQFRQQVSRDTPYEAIDYRLQFSAPPDGTYHIALLLSQFVDGEFLIFDWRNFTETVYLAEPDSVFPYPADAYAFQEWRLSPVYGWVYPTGTGFFYFREFGWAEAPLV